MESLRKLGIGIFIIGILLYGYAFHETDLAFNGKNGAVDVNGWGVTKDIVTMHLLGLQEACISVMFMIGGFMAVLK